ncbi:MAG: hypothetical protein ACK5YR_16530 [Pirellula sp.]
MKIEVKETKRQGWKTFIHFKDTDICQTWYFETYGGAVDLAFELLKEWVKNETKNK